MNDYQALIRDMENEESQLLMLRIADSRVRLKQTTVLVALGGILGLLITAVAAWSARRNNTRRGLAEEALFVEKERAQVTLNSIADAVICTDIAGNVDFLNLVAEKMTGWSLQDGAGKPLAEVFRLIDAASRELIVAPLKTVLEKN